MRGNATDLSRKTLLAGAASLLLAASPALAQDAGTWSLPAPTSQPSAQGPVDPLNPVVRPTTSAPATAAPTPAPTSVPTIIAPPPPASTTAAPSRQPQTPVPSAATPRPTPSATEPTPAPPAASPDSATVSTPVPSDVTPAASKPAAATPQSAGFNLWWLALPVFLLALGAFAWLRRRRPSEELAEWGTDDAVLDEITPEEPAPATPAPALTIPQPAFAEKAPPPAAAPRPDPQITFEPVSLRISLVYATLQYRVSITAVEDCPKGHLLGDMISAHASLSQEDQLAPSLDVLAPLREVPALSAGETQVLTGEIQLPLNAIRPLQRGNASFLVPLVRLVLMSDNRPALRRVFTVGHVGATALAPIRIDTGSRTVDGLAAREIEEARSLPVEPGPARRVAG